METSGLLTGKKGERPWPMASQGFPVASRKRSADAKTPHLGHYQNLILAKMIRNLKVHIQNMNPLSHHAESIFQVNRMPLFFLLIIKHSSKVCLVGKKKICLVSRELKRKGNEQFWEVSSRSPCSVNQSLGSTIIMQHTTYTTVRTVFFSLLCIILLMYLNLASLSPGESKTTLLIFASLDPSIPGCICCAKNHWWRCSMFSVK